MLVRRGTYAWDQVDSIGPQSDSLIFFFKMFPVTVVVLWLIEEVSGAVSSVLSYAGRCAATSGSAVVPGEIFT